MNVPASLSVSLPESLSALPHAWRAALRLGRGTRPPRYSLVTRWSLGFALLLVTARAHAQAPASSPARDNVAAGDRDYVSRQAAAALAHYELALESEPRNYEALYKASRQAIDLGEAEQVAATREALYAKGTLYARRAVDVNAADAEGHFALARALGRTALSLGPRDRVKYAVEVREQALAALRYAPNHPGALHVMGMWNAEVMRLNGVTRLVARTFLGGQIFSSANWSDAVKYLEQSVRVDPARAVHYLDMARVYHDVHRPSDARATYEAMLKLPLVDSNDEMYRRSAEQELRSLK